MAFPILSRLLAARRRRCSLALAVRLFECGSESEMARAVLTLSAATLFDRYLRGQMSLGDTMPAGTLPSGPAEPARPGERIVPFARPAPAEGA